MQIGILRPRRPRAPFSAPLSSFLPPCAALLTAALLAACAGAPNNGPPSAPAFQEAPRHMETRRYDGLGDRELLVACARVLQGLGFTLERVEADRGLITGVRRHESRTGGGPRPFGQFGLGRWGGFGAIGFSFGPDGSGGERRGPFDRDQTILATLTIRPAPDADGRAPAGARLVRADFRRAVPQADRTVRAEPLTDPEAYRTFHERLDKFIFPERR